jgi:hypothetical protein
MAPLFFGDQSSFAGGGRIPAVGAAGLRTLARKMLMSLSVSNAKSGRDEAATRADANASNAANMQPNPTNSPNAIKPGDLEEKPRAIPSTATSKSIQRIG